MGKQEIYSQPKKEIIIRVKKRKQKKSTYFLIGAAALILFIILTSAKTQQIEVRSTASEKYYVQVPVSERKTFNITEVYYEKAEFTGASPCRSKAYNFTEQVNWSYESINGNMYFVCRLNVTNYENKSGEWEYFAFIQSTSSNINFEYLNQRKTIDAMSNAIFIWQHKVSDMSEQFVCSAKRADIPQMTRCGNIGTYSLIPKTRIVETTDNITHYVPVEQKKDITTVKNDTAYVNRFFGYRQPFYFGY
jgi:hypothetical protein